MMLHSVSGSPADIEQIARNFMETQLSQDQCDTRNTQKLMVFNYNKELEQFTFSMEEATLSSVGGKAMNLAFLQNLGYVSVPAFSSIGSQVFKWVVNQDSQLQRMRDHLCLEIESYAHVNDKGEHEMKVFKLAAGLKDYVRQMDLPPTLVSESKKIYDLVSQNGTKSIAVRSSAKAEDLPGASFAGLYDSFLNILDFSAFLDGLKKCWASSFNDRAVQYYMQKGIAPRDVYMSCVVMQLVDGAVSGTVFTTDITNGYNGIHVMASNGLEAVVGGDISADSYLFHPEHFTILKRVKGSKEFMYVPSEKGSGMEKIAVGTASKEYCLTSEQARSLAKLVARIGQDYQSISPGPVDTEYVVDKFGHPFIVQVRPVVNVGVTEVEDVNFSALHGKPKILATGKHAVFGVKHGRVKIVEDFHSLECGEIKIDPSDIVVTTRTENEWTQYLSMFSGIITTEGNPTSHPVLISREKNVPCLVGVSNAIGKFREMDGQWITLDGFRKCVYPGRLPLKKVSMSEVKDAFAVVEEEKLQPEQEMIRDLFAKGFMREEEGKKWITGVNAYFSGALLNMVQNAYALREKVINDSGVTEKVSLKTDQKVFFSDDSKETGKVYDHWWIPHEQQLELCMRMTLDHFISFYTNKGVLMKKLVESCKQFDLTLESWKNIREIYEEVTAYQLLGFLERYPLIHQTYEQTKRAGIPRLFYEEYVSSVPDFEFEEDIAFLNETKTLALELLELSKKDQINLDSLSHEDVEGFDPTFFDRLVQFSRNYKFSKDEDWLNPPPVDKALAKIINQAKSGDFECVHKAAGSDSDIEYFCDQPELRESMRLSIVKKLQQNDIHHVRSRAQWHLRDKMIILGEYLCSQGLIDKPERVLVMSIDELEMHIGRYGKEAMEQKSGLLVFSK